MSSKRSGPIRQTIRIIKNRSEIGLTKTIDVASNIFSKQVWAAAFVDSHEQRSKRWKIEREEVS